MDKEIIVVSFSGGRTSAYMSWWLKEHMSHLYNFVFVYANTGQEHPKTLEFVNNVDKFLNMNLVWVEAVVHESRTASTHKVVTYETASRNGEPFEEVIKKYGLPNQSYLHCTRELKLHPIHDWIKVNGYKGCRQALGIRYDEYRRVKNDKNYIFPLANIVRTTKQDVLDFWKRQPFDLDLEEHLGNCFSGDTKFLTKDDGLIDFKSNVGKEVDVLTRVGWKRAIVNNFGKQELYEVELKSVKRKFKILTTSDHRWIVPKYMGIQSREFLTEMKTSELPIGKKILNNFQIFDNIEMDKKGIQHGFIFGNGSIFSESAYRVYIDENKMEIYKYFDYPKLLSKNRFSIKGKLGLKKIPNFKDYSIEYLKGFVAGLIAANGNVGTGATIAFKENSEASEFYTLSSNMGMSVSISKEKIRDTNFKKNATITLVRISNISLSEDMILRKFHKEKRSKIFTNPKMYEVVSIIKKNIDETYCVTVNDNKFDEFTLENGILTKNCTWCYKKSDKKLWKVAQEMPEAFTFIKKMENKYKNVKAPNGPRIIFRHNRKTINILRNNGYPKGYKLFDKDDCNEECGVISLEEIKKQNNIK